MMFMPSTVVSGKRLKAGLLEEEKQSGGTNLEYPVKLTGLNVESVMVQSLTEI
jgi:hypothetical protein